ncbi:hypothetical protein B9Z55_007085 [Caenorhabditis nigoni]|uniref:BTB domain-containing protein n=1 Tax=Caenorhabditis nigoni TaxID=1611254 RepID=A0A2G5V8Q7_9PELO|nr:hypothetical protein B9Z55_007085 [Caenorhabditis nigoni]
MPAPEKTFVLKHVFKNISEMEEKVYYDSKEEKHFGVPWKIYTIRRGNLFGIDLNCSWKSDEKWAIQTSSDVKLLSVNGPKMIKSGFAITINRFTSRGYCKYIEWDKMKEDYVIDDCISVEICVKIRKMTGIKFRNFDESNKQFSDVVLIYLASQSTYFNSLLLGKFEESEKSEIEIKDIKAADFQKFLELLYGESAIDESTIDGILHLADMCDAELAIRKCEKFLMEYSEKTMKEKLKLAHRYNLKNLQNKCMSKITTVSEISSVISHDVNEMDPSVVLELLQKSISLHKKFELFFSHVSKAL